MLKNLFYLLVIVVLVSGCGSGSESAGSIDYSKIDEIPLTLEIETLESDDYFHGQLADMVLASDGTMLVSDYGSTTIEQFSPNGEHVGTIAKQGGGPGELSQWFFMIDKGNDSLVVRHQSGMMVTYARKASGQFGFEYSISGERSAGPVQLVGPHPNGTFYATKGQIISDIAAALANPATHRETHLALVDNRNQIQRDSILPVMTPNPHIQQFDNGGIAVFPVPFRYMDRVRVHENGYVLGLPNEATFKFYNHDHELQETLVLDIAPRRISSEDLDYATRNMNENAKSAVLGKVGNFKPAFQNFWYNGEYLFLSTDAHESGTDIVVLKRSGTPVGKIVVPPYEDPRYFIGDRIYALNRNPEIGHSVRIYSW
jgi:hypothetical protein